jgi:2',3'-cyclic-nucleotide 2'-phosphodiesterase (5'-nucleotidase family)
VIGHAEVLLDGERERVRYEETALGNFIADIMLAHTAAQAALINSGAIRASIHSGPVTVEDVFKAMPYANEIMLVNLSGAELARVLARSVRSDREEEDGGFLQVADLFFEIKNRRVHNIRIGKDKAPLEQNRTYTVAIPDFLASGGDGYGVFKGKPMIETGLPLRELIVDTIKQRRTISAETQGRIKRLD